MATPIKEYNHYCKYCKKLLIRNRFKSNRLELQRKHLAKFLKEMKKRNIKYKIIEEQKIMQFEVPKSLFYEIPLSQLNANILSELKVEKVSDWNE